MDLQEKVYTGTLLGLYCHIPFCASTCDFCALYQKKLSRADRELFLKGMEQELNAIEWQRSVDVVFWGGGTPSLLSSRELRRIGVPQEWSVEVAPASVTPSKIRTLQDMGVTRISMGVQSFNAQWRQHTPPPTDRARLQNHKR